MKPYKSFFEDTSNIISSLSEEAKQIIKDGPYTKDEDALSWIFWHKPLDVSTKIFNKFSFTTKKESLVITLNNVLKELKTFKLIHIFPIRDFGKKGSHDKPFVSGYKIELTTLGYSVRKGL